MLVRPLTISHDTYLANRMLDNVSPFVNPVGKAVDISGLVVKGDKDY